MKATEANLLEFLQSPQQFVIPIYQRTYSWTLAQCQQLWNNIRNAATNPAITAHFVGSIVYIKRSHYQVSEKIPQQLVIDGQQRLTTITLLLAALRAHLEKQSGDGLEMPVSTEEINDYYLFNKHGKDERRYKLLLTQSDRETLIRLVEGHDRRDPFSRRMIENYDFFRAQLSKSNVDLARLYQGISKLLIVDISLNRDHDNPQLIFESLNSTGLDLSQADLVRNYVLMGLEPQEQDALYNNYWYPMEQSFGHGEYSSYFDRFMRDYLTVRTGRIPNLGDVYASSNLMCAARATAPCSRSSPTFTATRNATSASPLLRPKIKRSTPSYAISIPSRWMSPTRFCSNFTTTTIKGGSRAKSSLKP
jgi:uncharacterized protein with ParB-like and HNH nuclease domain